MCDKRAEREKNVGFMYQVKKIKKNKIIYIKKKIGVNTILIYCAKMGKIFWRRHIGMSACYSIFFFCIEIYLKFFFFIIIINLNLSVCCLCTKKFFPFSQYIIIIIISTEYLDLFFIFAEIWSVFFFPTRSSHHLPCCIFILFYLFFVI